jgi:hypothetical protein
MIQKRAVNDVVVDIDSFKAGSISIMSYLFLFF